MLTIVFRSAIITEENKDMDNVYNQIYLTLQSKYLFYDYNSKIQVFFILILTLHLSNHVTLLQGINSINQYIQFFIDKISIDIDINIDERNMFTITQ